MCKCVLSSYSLIPLLSSCLLMCDPTCSLPAYPTVSFLRKQTAMGIATWAIAYLKAQTKAMNPRTLRRGCSRSGGSQSGRGGHSEEGNSKGKLFPR